MANEYFNQKEINETKENWYNKFNTVSRFSKQDYYFLIRQEINHTHCSLKSKGFKKVELNHGEILEKDLDRYVQEERGTKKIDDFEHNYVHVDLKFAEINTKLNKSAQSTKGNAESKMQTFQEQKKIRQLSRAKSAKELGSASTTARSDTQQKYSVSQQYEKLAAQGLVKKEDYYDVEISHMKKEQRLQEKVLQTDKMNSSSIYTMTGLKGDDQFHLALSGQQNLEERNKLLDSKMFDRHRSAATLDLVRVASAKQTFHTSRSTGVNPKSQNFVGSRVEAPTSLMDMKHTLSEAGLRPITVNDLQSRFSSFGKEISNLESKAKKFSKNIARNQTICAKAYSRIDQKIFEEKASLNFAEVVTKLQHLEKEMLINDLNDVQYKKFKHQYEFANHYELSGTRKEKTIEELISGTNSIQINHELHELDIERINQSLQTEVQAVVKDTNHIYVMVAPDSLTALAGVDTLTQEQLNELRVEALFCPHQYDMGFLTRKDIEERKKKFKDKLSDINANLSYAKVEFESDRLSKGFIYPNYKEQMKSSYLLMTSRKEKQNSQGCNYLLKTNLSCGRLGEAGMNKLHTSLQQAFYPHNPKKAKMGYIKQANSYVSKKDLQLMGMETDIQKEINYIENDYYKNKYNGQRGDIFGSRKPGSKINFKRPATAGNQFDSKLKDLDYTTGVETQVVKPKPKVEEILSYQEEKEEKFTLEQSKLNEAKPIINNSKSNKNITNKINIHEMTNDNVNFAPFKKEEKKIMNSLKIQTENAESLLTYEKRWITDEKLVYLKKNEDALEYVNVNKINNIKD